LVRQVFEILASIQREGISLLLVEQNARAALAVSEHAYVLERGQIVLDGPARDLAQDERLKAAYLGGDVQA